MRLIASILSFICYIFLSIRVVLSKTVEVTIFKHGIKMKHNDCMVTLRLRLIALISSMLLTLKISSTVFLESIKVRILKLGIHKDNG